MSATEKKALIPINNSHSRSRGVAKVENRNATEHEKHKKMSATEHGSANSDVVICAQHFDNKAQEYWKTKHRSASGAGVLASMA